MKKASLIVASVPSRRTTSQLTDEEKEAVAKVKSVIKIAKESNLKLDELEKQLDDAEKQLNEVSDLEKRIYPEKYKATVETIKNRRGEIRETRSKLKTLETVVLYLRASLPEDYSLPE